MRRTFFSSGFIGRLVIVALSATLAATLALVAITVVGGVAFGAIVGERLQAENMTRSSTTQITIQSDPDGTGPAGSNLRWEAGSNTSVRASITITPNQQVNQIQTFVRQVGTNDAFAFYVDGVKVGTVTPPSGGAWGLRTINLASPIAAGSHQLQIGPNATLANRANVDWFELHNTGSTGGDTTPPLAPNITTGPAAGSTDTDGNVSFTWTGAETGGTFECSNVISGQVDNFSACTSPIPYDGLPNGSYIFKVRQKDAAGNVGAAASRNYSVSRPTGGDTTPPSAQDPSDGWFQRCAWTKTGLFDPIVYYNQPPPVGSQKLFYGATNISYNSIKGTGKEPTSLLPPAGGTTCRFKDGNNGGNFSAYWVPDLLLRDGTTWAGGKQLNAYYRKGASSVDANDIVPFPDGLKMVIRDRETMKTNVEWYCSNIDGEGNNGNMAERPYNCNPNGTYPYVTAHITFPQCGNGDTDTTDPQKYPVNDHISHVVYPSSGGCPGDHSQVYPRLFITAKYNTSLGSGALLAGGRDPATSFTSYYFEAWQPGRLQNYVDSCIKAGINCNASPPAG